MALDGDINNQTRDWLLEQHKEAYKLQAEKIDKIRDRVSFMSGLLTPLGGVIIYVLLNFSLSNEECSFLFYIPAVGSLILFIVAVGQVLYCLGSGYIYSNILTPRQLQDYAEKLSHYAASAPQKKIDLLDRIKTHLMLRYCEGATYNLQVNIRRTNLLLRATQISILSFGLLLFSLPKFFEAQAHKKDSPTKVIITKPIRIRK